MPSRRSFLGGSLAACIGCLIPSRDRWRKLRWARSQQSHRRKVIFFRNPVAKLAKGEVYVDCHLIAEIIHCDANAFHGCTFENPTGGDVRFRGHGMIFDKCNNGYA